VVIAARLSMVQRVSSKAKRTAWAAPIKLLRREPKADLIAPAADTCPDLSSNVGGTKAGRMVPGSISMCEINDEAERRIFATSLHVNVCSLFGGCSGGLLSSKTFFRDGVALAH
jgi:hypothetical protein